MARPFVRWAGGKSRLAPTISEHIDTDIGLNNIHHYIEAFAGGGAMLFYLDNLYQFETKTLIDINLDLINAYRAIQQQPIQLMENLDTLQSHFNNLNSSEDKSNFYYEIRDQYNNYEDKTIFNEVLDQEINYLRASQFIFLNKTCFNGLYRENRKGLYNVPFGKKDTINLYTLENVMEIHQTLQNTNIIWGDYNQSNYIIDQLLIQGAIPEQILVYFDPPYRPLPNTPAFIDYVQNGFTDINQRELAAFCRMLSNRNIHFALSNSDPNDGFFSGLYNHFKINKFQAARAIAARSSSRANVSEILITSLLIN